MEFAVIWLTMDRKIMHLGANAFCPQGFHESAPSDAQPGKID